jgi:hypothetical protein
MVMMVGSTTNTSPFKGWVASPASPLTSERTQGRPFFLHIPLPLSLRHANMVSTYLTSNEVLLQYLTIFVVEIFESWELKYLTNTKFYENLTLFATNHY